MEFFKYSK